MERTPGETQERPGSSHKKDREKVDPYTAWSMDRYDIAFLAWISGLIAALTYLNPEGYFYVLICLLIVAYVAARKIYSK